MVFDLEFSVALMFHVCLKGWNLDLDFLKVSFEIVIGKLARAPLTSGLHPSGLERLPQRIQFWSFPPP